MNVGARRWIANLAALALMLCAWVLLRFPPASSSFYPQCPIYFWLHLQCPGCGGTRAVAALLQGKVQEALHWNAMVVLFLPFAVGFFAVTYWRAVKPASFSWPTIANKVLALFLVLSGIFTLVRNIPSH